MLSGNVRALITISSLTSSLCSVGPTKSLMRIASITKRLTSPSLAPNQPSSLRNLNVNGRPGMYDALYEQLKQ